MAMITKAQMLTQVRSQLNEPVAMFWTDTELDNYLSMGVRTMSGITLCTPSSELVNNTDNSSWAEGTLSAPFTTKFIKIISVEAHVSGGLAYNGTPVQLQRLDIRSFGHGAPASATTNQLPQWYYIFGQRIFVWPCPKGTTVAALAGDGGYLRIHGYRTAWNYDRYALTTDTPSSAVYDIPDRLQPRLIDFVLACAYIKSGKYSLTKYHMQNFMQNCMMDRRDVFESNQIVDSNDNLLIPDFTRVAGQ